MIEDKMAYPMYDTIDLTQLADSITSHQRPTRNYNENTEIINLDEDSEHEYDYIFDNDLPSDDNFEDEPRTLEEMMNLDIYKNPKKRVAKLKATIRRRVREYDLRMERLEREKQEKIRLEQEKERQRLKRLNQIVKEQRRAERKEKRTKCPSCKDFPKEISFGNCPICWEELGDDPMAATTCGHVFCMECIRRYLSQEKKCPSCRTELIGPNVYHQLYLSQGI